MLFGFCLVAAFGLATYVDCESSLCLQGCFSVSHKLCVTGFFVSVVTGCLYGPSVFLPILIGTGMVAVGVASVNNVCQLYKFYSYKEVVTQPVKVAVGFTLAVFAIKVALTTPSPWVLAKHLDRLIASLLWNLALLLWSLTWLIWTIVASLTLFLWNLVVFLASFAFAVLWTYLQFYALMIKEEPFWTTLLIIMQLFASSKSLAPTADTTTTPTAKHLEEPKAKYQANKEPQVKPKASLFGKVTPPSKPATPAEPVRHEKAKPRSTCRYCLYDNDNDEL